MQEKETSYAKSKIFHTVYAKYTYIRNKGSMVQEKERGCAESRYLTGVLLCRRRRGGVQSPDIPVGPRHLS